MTALMAPAWLTAWRGQGLSASAALTRFDGLPDLPVDAMLGRWRGVSLATGHPLDGVLEGLGWYGKAFERADRVHPLLFRTVSGAIAPLDPPRLLASLGLRLPGLGRHGILRRAFRVALPLLRAQNHAARLEEVSFRGVASAAMVYERLPILDHFRRIDADRVLGLMVAEKATEPYFFFLLCRDAPARTRRSGRV